MTPPGRAGRLLNTYKNMKRAIARPLDISRSSPYFLALLVMALVAFWPSYLSQLVASSAYIHLHALAATLWLLLLIAQPLAVRKRRMQVHRSLGKASFVLAPLMVLSIVLLAHSRIKALGGEAYGIQTYILCAA